MSAPGVTIKEQDPTVAPRSPRATDGWFVVAGAQRGPIGVLEVTPGTVDKLGDVIAASQMRESAEAYFARGGQYLAFSRLVGPNPTFGGTTLKDAEAHDALIFAMREPGNWTEGWKSKVVVVASNTVKIQFFNPEGELELETPGFASAAEAVAWAEDSDFVKFTAPGEAHWPPVQAEATAFTTQGNDDLAEAGEAQKKEALARLVKDLGPGQVTVLGDTTGATHLLTGEHTTECNRVAINDLVDTSTEGTLTTASLADRAALSKDAKRRSGDFASWIVVAGDNPLDANRTLPPSVAVAAKIAQNDLAGLPVSQAPAGGWGDVTGVIGLSQPQPAFTDEQRDTLNEDSVNIARTINGVVKLYGFRSLTDPAEDPAWKMLTAARTVMLVEAIIGELGEASEFALVDAKGEKAGILQARIESELKRLWENKALFGATAADAFSVTVAGEPSKERFASSVTLTVTPTGETVSFTVTNRPVGG